MKWTRYTDNMGQTGYMAKSFFVYKPQGTNYWCVQDYNCKCEMDNSVCLWSKDFPTLREAKAAVESEVENQKTGEFINSFLRF